MDTKKTTEIVETMQNHVITLHLSYNFHMIQPNST